MNTPLETQALKHIGGLLEASTMNVYSAAMTFSNVPPSPEIRRAIDELESAKKALLEAKIWLTALLAAAKEPT